MAATRQLNPDLQNLKDYVTADTGAQRQGDSTVRIMVTHSNLAAKFLEIRLDKHMSIDSVKSKLCFHCGTSPSAMVLHLRDERGRTLATLSDGARPLGYYSPEDGYQLHVEDTDPTSLSAGGWLEDVSKVDKYVMSDGDYAQRENTYRKYKEGRLREDPEWTLEKEMAKRRGVAYVPRSERRPGADDPEHQAEEASGVPLGARCEVEGGRRGAVRYVGKCEGLPPGYWVGVQYDEPVGKNDGSVKGRRYFECGQGYGGFVRPAMLRCGDFPPFDEDFEFSEGDEL